MEKFFNPKSVVVIGSSNSPFNLGATISKTLNHLKYNGKVYVVNSKGEDVNGSQGFKSVIDIPDVLDLAIIITPAKIVPLMFRECAKKGIKRIIIESAGFSEEGDEGKRLQEDIIKIAGANGIRFMGPNCLGSLNVNNRFCCFFGIAPGDYDDLFDKPGTVSYIIQSGGVGALILDSLRRDIAKVNKMVSIGNKEDIDEADFIKYFNSDNTEVIGLYLESIKNGRKFLETARGVKKPIMVYKVGKTGEGARAAMSHTAGMANNHVIFESACNQAGIITLKSISELHSLPKIFISMPLLKGKRILIFSNSGAFGGISSDLLMESGLTLAQLSEDTQNKLKNAGKLYNYANPVDLGPMVSKQSFIDIFEIILSSNEVDGMLAVPNVWHPVVIECIARLVEMCRHYEKPAAIYIPNQAERIIEIRNVSNIPIFESLEEAVRALSISYTHFNSLKKKESMQSSLGEFSSAIK